MEELLKIVNWPAVGLVLGVIFLLSFRKPISIIISRISSVGKDGIKIKHGGSDTQDIGKRSNSIVNEDVKFYSNQEMSEHLRKKLADTSVSTIQIFTYTNEVESGSINKYRINGQKNIEIFKRSILSDLREQQQSNLDRIWRYRGVLKLHRVKSKVERRAISF